MESSLRVSIQDIWGEIESKNIVKLEREIKSQLK